MKFQKLTAALLALTIVIAVLPLQLFSFATAPAAWDGSAANGFAGGSGTSDNPYLISSAAELTYLAQQVNGGEPYEGDYFLLTDDIYLNDPSASQKNNWTPIGNGAWSEETQQYAEFAGIFDGGLCKIVGLYCDRPEDETVGLFGNFNGEIYNLSLEDSYVRGNYAVGGIAGSFTGYMYNCHNNGTVLGHIPAGDDSSASNIGGLVGQVWDNCTLCDCTNAATVGCTTDEAGEGISVQSVGGLVGGIAGYDEIELLYCSNSGDIQLTVPCAEDVGGLIGNTGYDTTVSNCYNRGKITITNMSDLHRYTTLNIGGLFGTAGSGLVASNCYNAGDVTVNGLEFIQYIGGIAGYVEINPSDYYYSGKLSNCYNVGSIAATTQYQSSIDENIRSVGGAVGYVYRSGYVSELIVDVYYLDTCLAEEIPAEAIRIYGNALTAEEMQTQAAFVGFDFTLDWTFDPSLPGGYPTLSPATCAHSYVNGVCTVCEESCDHYYWTADGTVCRQCGVECKHNSWQLDQEDGKVYCEACGKQCRHAYEDSICIFCKFACTHDYYDGACTLCNATCSDHQWNSETGKCGICTFPCDHCTVQNGICLDCGWNTAHILPWDGWGDEDDYAELSFAAGDGTLENPYRITNGDELFYFALCVSSGVTDVMSAYVILTCDIDLADHPFPSIGCASYNWSETFSFSGNFDGRGHKIVGYHNAEQGLFGSVFGSSSDAPAGPDALGRIANVHVYGTVDSNAYGDVGGIVGKGDSFTLVNCSFTGQITVTDCGYNFFGGIAGEYQYGFILNCTSDTDIDIVGGPRSVGGIVGGGEYGAPLVDGCANLGDVKAESAMQLGGIGKAEVILNSYNSGTVTAYGDCANVCGIGGRYVLNCYNTGDIGTAADCSATYGNIYAVGGDYTLNCYNTGKLLLHFPEGVEINEDTNQDGSADVYASVFYGDYSVNDCYTTPSAYPAVLYYDRDNWTFIFLYEEGVKTLDEMSAPAFAQMLTSNAATLGAFSLEETYGQQEWPLSPWKSSETTPVFGIEEEKNTVTVEVFTQTTDRNPDFEGQVSMEGLTCEFAVGEQVVLTAVYNGNAYRFIGWYAVGNYTKVLSHSKTYTFTVTEEMLQTGTYALVALYEKIEMADITVNAPLFSINGEKYASQNKNSYLPGTQLTVAVSDSEDFAYWENAQGKILSTQPSYTFTVVEPTVLNAVYNTKIENKKIILFVSPYGQVMQRVQLTYEGLDSLNFPPVPIKAGYEAGRWGMTVEQIKEAFAKAEVEVITVTPVYPQIVETKTVTVTGGTLQNTASLTEGQYQLNSVITVVADPAMQDTRFAYWTDTEGNILSYESTYSFFLTEDTELTAVFIPHTQAVEKLGTAEISEVLQNDTVSGISFVATFSAPQGSTVHFAGIVATSDSTAAQNLTRETADYVRGGAQAQEAGRFTWTKSNAGATTTWYVRAYLVFTDAEGVTHTVYSSVVQAQYGMIN